jgi:predicted nucleotidyltransferase
MRATNRLDDVAKRFLDQKLDVIRQHYAPTHLVVFGSRAAGTARAGSDIDLIIVSARFREISVPDRMGDFLNTVRPDVAVDAICYTPEEFDALVDKQWPFVKNAVKTGIRIE